MARLHAKTIVSLPANELDRIYRVCSPPYRALWARDGWQAILSCNARYHVWPSLGYGKSKPEERELLPLEDFPHLRRVVTELLRKNDLGGRIFVRDDVLYYATVAGKEELCEFGVVERAPRLLVRR